MILAIVCNRQPILVHFGGTEYGKKLSFVPLCETGILMGDRISLRAIFLVTATAAIASLLIRLAIVSQGRTMVLAALTCLAMPVIIFALYGLLYLLLLPFGILSEITRESFATPTSPFATDRLPENQLPTSEPDRAH